MIEARIRKSFRPGRGGFALEVDFQAPAGISVLLGASGAGKTVILDAIAGFLRPDEGRIMLDDRILFDAGAGVNLPPRARQCGYVFPGYALFPHMTVRQSLAFAVRRRPRLERHRRVNETLERFGLTECAARCPPELAGSERLRAAVARVLIGSPRALLLDEPARGLEAGLRAELYALLRQLRAELQIPVLLATERLEECFELGDAMLVLRAGRILQAGAPRSLAERPASLEAARLLGIFNVLPAEILELDPQRNSSRLRLGEHTLIGPYFPGKLRGDRVWLCVRPDQLQAWPGTTRPGPNQIPAQLLRAVELPHSVRLEFSGELAVELSRAEYERQKHNREWLVEFPPHALKVL
jgi:ABC-type sulfate/molybdate transport systems ATPase subunit